MMPNSSIQNTSPNLRLNIEQKPTLPMRGASLFVRNSICLPCTNKRAMEKKIWELQSQGRYFWRAFDLCLNEAEKEKLAEKIRHCSAAISSIRNIMQE